MKAPNFIIVVGTSAGGMNALIELVSQLKDSTDAAFFIVMHLSRTSISDFLVHRLQPHTSLKCEVAKEDAKIEKGHIYVAAPNQHLLVKKNKIILGRGPEENRWRPSIDVLFRSAAAAYSTRVIGVVLTGSLDDGTTGMLAIKRSGGTCIVQDPNQAEYPDMPLSVLNNMDVDYCIPLDQMGETFFEISQTNPKEIAAPQDVIIESEIAERVVVDYENVKQLGVKSIYACPDCGGGLWDIPKQNDNLNDPDNHRDGQEKSDRYRCHIGHSYSEKDLVVKQGEILESTLWIALRIMEERRTLLKKMEDDNNKNGLSKMAASYQEKGEDIQFHVNKMKEILFATQKTL
ncbi:chemotaxis protein CheB [Gillisia limnaea]|uniref:protein-glutamate methylesterase n=1 Tax=Gillisia limnaea (strain DSM 15749 / LMG 21470 / R-8282) TaxID=865937 RepID=H2BVV6_GILLR|nr:chemotaxis protein CheB [Gillisia limnaea]EHQ01839.1 CheB methylesterase [Gillisia limnaea DSM 15749]